MENDSLIIGQIYDTIILGKRAYNAFIKEGLKRRALYIGRLPRKDIIYTYVLITRNEGDIEVFRFEDYKLKDGKLNIFYAVRSQVSNLERKFVDERLKSVEL